MSKPYDWERSRILPAQNGNLAYDDSCLAEENEENQDWPDLRHAPAFSDRAEALACALRYTAFSEGSLARRLEEEEAAEAEAENARRRAAQRRQEQNEALRELRRSRSHLRLQRLLAWLSVISFFAAVYGGLMLRQARIFEQNFAVTRLHRQIAEQEEANTDLRSSLYTEQALALVEQEALLNFHLRKASQSQRVLVRLPETDEITYYDQGDGSFAASSGAAGRTNNYQVLEAYMKASQKNTP